MPTPLEDLDEIVTAARTFIAQHVDALAAWPAPEPERAASVAGAFRDGVDGTLREQVDAVHAAVVAAARDAGVHVPPPAARADVAAVIAEVDAARGGDAGARLTAAHAHLAKRVDELTGTLYAYRQVLLAARIVPEDAAATVRAVTRVREAHARAADGAARVTRALDAWRHAARVVLGADGAEVGAAARAEDALHAARVALAADAPDAARAALAIAIARAFTQKVDATGLADALAAWDAAGARLPAPADAILTLHVRLTDAAPADAVAVWRLLDAVEHVVNVAGMTPVPARVTR